MVYLVYLQEDRLDNIMNDEIEILMAQPLCNIFLSAGEHIIYHCHAANGKERI